MIKRPLLPVLCTAALVSGPVAAVGLGNIVLLSHIGEPLKAEVPLIVTRDETPELFCFSLERTSNNPELPAVTTMRTRLVQRDSGYILQLIGTKPINEPLITLNLHVQCGTDLQREYVLSPEAPRQQPNTPVGGGIVTRKQQNTAAPYRIWQTGEGDTLASIAAATAKPGEAARLLKAIKQANPHLTDDALGEGTEVRIPRQRTATAPESPAPIAAPTETREASAAKPDIPSTPPSARKSRTKPAQGDRLQLSSAPLSAEELAASRQSNRDTVALSALEDRMMQMETSLRLLHLEIEKLDHLIVQAEKTGATDPGLRASRELAAAPKTEQPIPAIPTTEPQRPQRHNNAWLELALGMLLGGLLTFGLLFFLEHRKRRASYEPESLPPPQPYYEDPSTELRFEQASAQPLRPASGNAFQDDDHHLATFDIEYDEEESVLALAQALIARGQVDAAEHTLANHIADRDPDGFLLWNTLLSIYHMNGNRQEFEYLANKMHRKFNIEVTSWEMTEIIVAKRKSLEDYRHISEHVQQIWATRPCLTYLYALIYDTRAGQRHGFPLSVIDDVMLLIRILEDAYALRRD